MKSMVVSEREIGKRIYEIRGHRVMLDRDLAELYEVPTKQLNLAVKRNAIRFPADFMFRLTAEEHEILRCQIGTSSSETGHGGRRYLPLVFTEHGVAMLSSVLNSERAIQVNIGIIRSFIGLRQMFENNRDLARRLDDLEKKYDGQFKVVFHAIRELMASNQVPRKSIKGLNR